MRPCPYTSFDAEHVIKLLKNGVQCRRRMNQRNVRKVTRTQCVYFRCSLQLVADLAPVLRRQCQPQKWVVAVLAAAATSRLQLGIQLVKNLNVAVGDQQPVSKCDAGVLATIFGGREL